MINTLKPLRNSKVYTPAISPEKAAWLTAFYIENHLDPITHPDHAAPPEQVRFMVYLDEDERYYPCSNRMFEAIMRRGNSRFLQKKYQEVLQRVMALVADQIEDQSESQYLESLIKIKYEHETRDQIMIPSRLEKRLIQIFLNRTQIEDPYMYEKALRNYRAHNVLKSKTLQKALNHIDPSAFKDSPNSLAAIRGFTDQIVIQRLFSLSVENTLWETDSAAQYQLNDFQKIFKKDLTGNGVKPLIDF